jgi:hypothetical protein
MVNLALWLKKNDFKLDQVQTFMPTPMALATTMYHTRKNPLKKITADSEVVETARSGKIRKFHKALLRYHAPENYEVVKEGLLRMGRSDLIGSSERHLIPSRAPAVASLVNAGVVPVKRGIAPKLNTFGKNSASRIAAKVAPNTSKSGLSYNAAKPKTVTAKVQSRRK